MTRAGSTAVAATLGAVIVGLTPWPGVHAQAPAKVYVLRMSYEVGARILDDEFTIRLSDRTIQFSCDSFDDDKGPIVPRAGGSNTYSEDTDQTRQRACRITVRWESAQTVFFDTLKTTVMKQERDKTTGQPVTHQDAISFRLTFTGASCQVSAIRYVYNANANPFRITASSCQ